MLRHGSPIWLLWLFGLMAAPSGLWLWHGQAGHFGLGQAHGKVNVKTAYSCLLLCFVLVALELTLGGE